MNTDPEVAELLLCATNDGKLYETYCETAYRATQGRPTSTLWANLAQSYASAYEREWKPSERFSAATVLALAVAMEDYYRDHIAEWNPADLLKRFGDPTGGQIDHIDGNPRNNDPSNLRLTRISTNRT